MQLSLLRSMLVFNMLVVGGPTWQQAFGASAVVAEESVSAGRQGPQSRVAELDLHKGEALGTRVARLAAGWAQVRRHKDAQPSSPAR